MLVLLVLIAFFIILPFLFPFIIHTKPTDASLFKKQIDMLKMKQADSTDKYAKRNFDKEDYQNYLEPDDSKAYVKKNKRRAILLLIPICWIKLAGSAWV